MKILVTCAGGNQGKLMIPRLAAAGHQVRATRVSGGKDAELEALGADEVIVGDLSDADFYTRALDGCDAVYHIGPGGIDKEKEKGAALIAAAQRCGTQHVVMSSVFQSTIDIVQHRYKRDIEEALYRSGLNWTIIKPCDFMMKELHIDPILKSGTLEIYWDIKPGRRGSLIDIIDLVDVSTKVLLEGQKHYFANYELVGPDKLTPQQMARIMSRVLGREIPVVQKGPDDLFESLFHTRQVAPELAHFHEVLVSISNYYAQFDFIGNPNILEWLLGRKPTDFETFFRRELADRGAL